MTRRVVTGVRGGKGVFISDEQCVPQTVSSIPGLSFAELWTAPSMPSHPASIEYVPSRGYLPGKGVSQLQIVNFPPDAVFSSPEFDPAAAAAEQLRLMPGVASHYDPDHPGMHATPSLDYVIVLSGRLELELDDGARKLLHPGDVVIQCGARHAWRNTSDTTATIAVVLIGDAEA